MGFKVNKRISLLKNEFNKLLSILSAAHCTFGRANNGVFAVVGTSFLNSGGVSHRSERIVNHPSYNNRNVANE
jgi:hypothetical protein